MGSPTEFVTLEGFGDPCGSWGPLKELGEFCCARRESGSPPAQGPSTVLWPLRELGCPSTCAEGVQGSQGYRNWGPPGHQGDVGVPVPEGIGVSPLYQGVPRTLPPSLRNWGSPPVPESRGDPRAHPVPSGSCSVPPKERWGPSPHALSHLGMGCMGSPCLSPMGLGVPQGLGVHGVTSPYTSVELGSP